MRSCRVSAASLDERVARVRQAGKGALVRDGIIGEDVCFAPPVRQQADNELHRQARPANDQLAGQHARVERDRRLLNGHGSANSPWSAAL